MVLSAPSVEFGVWAAQRCMYVGRLIFALVTSCRSAEYLSRFSKEALERTGCYDAYGGRPVLDSSGSPRFEMVTRESDAESERPLPVVAVKPHGNAIVNGTKLEYLMIRKVGSRFWDRVMKTIAAATTSSAYDRVLPFTFVKEPLERLLSGYHEIVERKIDKKGKGGWCRGNEDEFVCRHPYKSMPQASKQRFEAFVRAMFVDSNHTVWGRDHISYHVMTQASSISRFYPIHFVGKMHDLRTDFFALLAMCGVADPEAYLASVPDLRAQLDLGRAQKETRLPRDMGRRSSKAPRPQSDVRQAGASDVACLSPPTRRTIVDYFRQDFACFGFPTAAYKQDAGRCDPGRLKW